MFVLLAALISSVSFAQNTFEKPLTSFPGCIDTPKTFSILNSDSSFQKISFIGTDIIIDSASPNEPLKIPCGNTFFNDNAKPWLDEAQDTSPDLEDVMLDFLDKSKEPDKVAHVITNKNEAVIHSKVLIRQNGIIELHNDNWPQDVSLKLHCGPTLYGTREKSVEIYDGKKRKFSYFVDNNDKEPKDPNDPPAKGSCPKDDYVVSLTSQRILKVEPAAPVAAPKIKKATSGAH